LDRLRHESGSLPMVASGDNRYAGAEVTHHGTKIVVNESGAD